MAGTLKRIGPTALTATLTTNVYNNASALLYDSIKHIRVVNKNAAARLLTLYVGATGANAAGTELAFQETVPALGELNIYYPQGLKVVSTDFIVGGSSVDATSLVFWATTEQQVV